MVFIILGIIIMLYPSVNDRYESYQQQGILKQWQENFWDIDHVEPEPGIATDLIPPPIPADCLFF